MAPLVGLTLLFTVGCLDSTQDDAERAADVVRESTAELSREVRSELDQLGAQMERIDQRYSSATEEVAATWSDTRSEVRQYRERLEADLERLASAGVDESQRLKREMAGDIERLTERLERAELESIEGEREFLSASRDHMIGIERDLSALGDETASLSGEARDEASDALDELRERASELGTRLDELADATVEEIASERADITQAIGALAGAAQRELFEVRHLMAD